ncbi:MAG: hypothetical protein WBA22_10710 [Candidatus Methanofastidiosia archaeon]
MGPSSRMSIIALVIISSALSSFLFIEGIHIYASELLKYVIYLPFHAVFGISSLAIRAGIHLPPPYVFLIGVVLSAGYLFFLIRRAPPSLSCTGISVIFFVFLVIVGQRVFVKVIFLPQATGIAALLSSLKILFEFLIGLAVIYILLGAVDPPAISSKDNLFKRGAKKGK